VALEPEVTYAIWINTEEYRSFQDTDGHAAVPYLVIFRTAAGGESLEMDGDVGANQGE
jgi:hypothetical protein